MNENVQSRDTRSEDSQDSEELEFHYMKSPTFHTMHVDGMVVAPNASGMAAITFYNERLAIPRTVAMDIHPETGEPISNKEKFVDGKSGVIRTMEATAFMSLSAARDLRLWLDRVIAALEEIREVENSAFEGE